MLLRGKIARPGKFFAVRLLLQIKRADVSTFVGERATRVKFLVLRVILQGHVRFDDAIDEFAFLLLRTQRGDANYQQASREKLPHIFQAAEVTARRKENCRGDDAFAVSRAGNGQARSPNDNSAGIILAV